MELDELIKTEQSNVKEIHYEYQYQYKGELKAIDYYIRMGANWQKDQGNKEVIAILEDLEWSENIQNGAREELIKLTSNTK